MKGGGERDEGLVSQRNRATRTREEQGRNVTLDRPSKPFPFASRGEIRNNNGRMFFIVFTEYTSTALSNNG